VEEPLGVGKNTLHRAVSLQQHGFLVSIVFATIAVGSHGQSSMTA